MPRIAGCKPKCIPTDSPPRETTSAGSPCNRPHASIEAYRSASKPVERASYLLSLRGIDALSETDTALPAGIPEEQLECREAMAEAVAGRDVAALSALHKGVEQKAAAL